MCANSRMCWNVRESPSAAIWWGARPWMVSPRSATVPASGGRTPETQVEERRLARAVRADDRLHRPLRARGSETSFTAWRPPKRFERPLTSRSGVTPALRAAGAALAAAESAPRTSSRRIPSGAKSMTTMRIAAEDGVVERAEDAAQREEVQHRARGERAPQAPHAAHRHDGDVADRLHDAGLAGADAAVVVGEEHAAHRGEHRGEDEDAELVAGDVHAHRARPRPPRRGWPAAPGRRGTRPGSTAGAARAPRAPRRCSSSRRATARPPLHGDPAKRGNGGTPAMPSAAPSRCVPEHDARDDGAEAEGRHREVVPLELQHRDADQRTRRRGRAPPRRRTPPRGAPRAPRRRRGPGAPRGRAAAPAPRRPAAPRCAERSTVVRSAVV